MRDDYFEDWRKRPLHKSETFVSDGIIDEYLWNTHTPKVLFLLIEAHSEEGEPSWDLIEGQIMDYNPDIVIGGNTWTLIKNKIGNPRPVSHWVYPAFNSYFVDAYHPAARIAAMYSYHAVSSLVNQSGILSKSAKP